VHEAISQPPHAAPHAPAEALERRSTGCSPGCSTGCSSGWSQSNPPRSPRSPTQRHLRASRPADISTSHRCRNMNSDLAAAVAPMIAPLTLGAAALTSALATQPLPLAPPRLRTVAAARCGVNGEPEGAGPVSRVPLAPFALGAIAIASALPTQRFSAERRCHRPGAAWCGAVGGPLVACLAMARRGESCQQTRRGRGRARSARVVAVHREEADLDRFVAALLALACEPGGRGERRPGQPRARTGKTSPAEQSCRRR
jgi:hypothetical protein